MISMDFSASYLYMKFLYEQSGAKRPNEKIERKSDEKEFFMKAKKKILLCRNEKNDLCKHGKSD